MPDKTALWPGDDRVKLLHAQSEGRPNLAPDLAVPPAGVLAFRGWSKTAHDYAVDPQRGQAVTSGLHHHAVLNRSLDEVEARLYALDAPAPDPHGDEADRQTARQAHQDLVVERVRLETHRRLLLAALLKIERGTYGICEECRQPIGAKRLDATPWVAFCLGCQTAAEIREDRARRMARPPAGPEIEDEGAA